MPRMIARMAIAIINSIKVKPLVVAVADCCFIFCPRWLKAAAADRGSPFRTSRSRLYLPRLSPDLSAVADVADRYLPLSRHLYQQRGAPARDRPYGGAIGQRPVLPTRVEW